MMNKIHEKIQSGKQAKGMVSKHDIAIVGIACRYPNANDYNEYWENLIKGINSIREITQDRWDVDEYYSQDLTLPNKIASKWGGLIDGIDFFDNQFFNISPHEAQEMDPQQRLLLEETWHCIEDSGICLKELQEHKTSVYVGISGVDYAQRFAANHSYDSYDWLGNNQAILANRTSYFFNFTGDSLTLNAACASALAALHDAKRSLLCGESEYAIAAGVNLICHPWRYIAYSKSHSLSPDGQCKTFDAEANGYVPGEGVGVLLLEPLEKAIERGHHIYGILKSSAMTHCGRGKSLTAPRVKAQRQVIESALRQGNISPESITYIEAHGTGTSLGDPIEIEALTQAFNTKKMNYCYVGSVKSNIGHLTSASGIASVIKVLLMMRHHKIPKTLNIKTVNPIIDFENSPFQLASELRDWTLPKNVSARRAGVSSFGIGGVNAHVIIEEYSPTNSKKRSAKSKSEMPFLLSAKSPENLQALLKEWQRYIQTERFQSQDLKDICYTLAIGREEFSYRYTATVKDKKDLIHFLNEVDLSIDNLARRKNKENYAILSLKHINVIDYQNFHAICQLYPILTQIEKNYGEEIRKLTKGHILLEMLNKKSENSTFKSFSVLYILSKALLAGGLVPDCITGEGIGKLTALVVNGMLPLNESIKYIAEGFSNFHLKRPTICFYDNNTKQIIEPYELSPEYFRLLVDDVKISTLTMERIIKKAKQLLINQFTFKKFMDEWEPILNNNGILIETALNSPETLAIKQRNLFIIVLLICMKKLNQKWDLADHITIDNANASEIIDLFLDQVLTAKDVAKLLLEFNETIWQELALHVKQQAHRPDPFKPYSLLKKLNLSVGEIQDIKLWTSKLLDQSPLENRDRLFPHQWWDIEIASIKNQSDNTSTLSIMDLPRLAFFLTELWQNNFSIDWSKWSFEKKYHLVPLPVYPFSKDKQYWITEALPDTNTALSRPLLNLHPILDAKISTTVEMPLFTKLLTGEEFYLADHQVNGHPMLPGVAYLEMARAAGVLSVNEKNQVVNIRNVCWIRPIQITDKSKEVQIRLHPEGNSASFEVITEMGNQNGPTIHAQGKIIYSEAVTNQPAPSFNLPIIKQRCTIIRTRAVIYPYFKKMGLQYGTSFQVIEETMSQGQEILAKLHLPSHLQNEAHQFGLHPSLMDGALQTALNLLWDDAELIPALYLPFTIGELTIFGNLSSTCYVYATLSATTNLDWRQFQIYITDENGNVLVHIKDFIARAFHEGTNVETCYYQPVWEEQAIQQQVIANANVLVVDKKEILFKILKQEMPSDLISFAGLGSDYTDVLNLLDKQDRLPKYVICNSRDIDTLLTLSKAIIQRKPNIETYVIFVNEIKNKHDELYTSAIVGFAITLHLEHPKFICRVVEVPVNNLAVLEAELTQKDTEVRYDQNQKRWTKHYQEMGSPSKINISPLIKRSGVYLITGGAGGLGGIFSRYLAQHYQAKLIWMGRSELNDKQKSNIKELEALGSEVIYLRADVTKRDDLVNVIREIKTRFGRLNGIIHSAGVIRDAFILKKTPQEAEIVLAPKINGSLYLDELTQSEPLDFFVMFSSISSVLANIAQSDYAYANGFMDGFARYREELREQNQRQGKTISINWPLWAEGGMQIDEASILWLKQTLGAIPLLTHDGVQAFIDALGHAQAQVIVLAGQKQKLAKHLGVLAHKKPDVERATIVNALSVDKNLLLEEVQKQIIQMVSSLLKLDIRYISAEEGLSEYGMDSISVTNFTNQINSYYTLELTPAILFEHQTLRSFAEYLIENYQKEMEKQHKAVVPIKMKETVKEKLQEQTVVSSEMIKPVATVAANIEMNLGINNNLEINNQVQQNDNDIAIIGMSSMFPGSPDLDSFWNNLIEGKSLITEIPKDRWDWQTYYGTGDNQTKIKWGGFIDHIDHFDADYFNITRYEAELMDPAQRIFLQTVCKTIEDAGYSEKKLDKYKTGVFVGVTRSDYAELLTKMNETAAYVATGNAHSILANRVSFLLNLSGPSEAIDTACSSSLFAIHHAVQAIQNGDCEMAIAGGVNVLVSPSVYIEYSRAGMLSEDGCCKTFDKSANGYARGEGVGAILLKSLNKALVDKDHIYGVIKGTAVNHGGHVQGLTVPNPNAQTEVITTACERAHIDITTVSYVEAHGTGTALGDPIEINGLKKAFRTLQEKQGKTANTSVASYCGIGTVKTNIGHLEAAAGIAGVIKVLLAMQYGKLPAIIHFKELNPYIDLNQSPFYIVNKIREWVHLKDQAGNEIPRRAGISSFGFGGANAHVVIEEAADTKQKDNVMGKPYYLVPLSAKTDNALKQKITDLECWLQKNTEKCSLADLSYTLNVGRNHYEKRCAMVVSSIAELQVTLHEIKECKTQANAFIGLTQKEKPQTQAIFKELFKQLLRDIAQFMTLSADEYRDKLLALANFYTEGYNLDGELLHHGEENRKISLPTYPFAKEHYWVEVPKEDATLTAGLPVLPVKPEMTKALASPPTVKIDKAMLSEKVKANLVKMVAKLLKLAPEKIDVKSNFSEYGLDSISFMNLMNQVNLYYRLELGTDILFVHKTINSLAKYLVDDHLAAIEGRDGNAPETEDDIAEIGMNSVTLDQSSDETDTNVISIPLSYLQFNMWLLWRIKPKSILNNMIFRYRLAGKLEIDALNFAFKCVFTKHKILTYQISHYLPLQYPQKKFDFHIFEKNLNGLSEENRERELMDSTVGLSKFNSWEKGSPLVFAKLFYLENELSELQVCIPHIVIDEWSCRTLMSELSHYYVNYKNNLTNCPESALYSYRDYILDEREQIKNNIRRDIDFWEKYLQNAAAFFSFPTEMVLNPSEWKNTSCETYLKLPENILDDLTAICVKNNIDISSCLCAALGLTLAQYSESHEQNRGKDHIILFTKVIKGKYENTIGPFMYNEVIRLKLNNAVNLIQLAKDIRKSRMETEAYQHSPLMVMLGSSVSKNYWKNRKISYFIWSHFFQFIIKSFPKLKFNREYLMMLYITLILDADAKKNKSHQNFLVKLNVLNSFIVGRINDDTELFGYKLEKLTSEITKGPVKNLLNIKFATRHGLDKYLIIESKLKFSIREQIGKSIIKYILDFIKEIKGPKF
jgi:acyl transferase domain-containing protein